MSVAIVYATKYGSTREAAQMIARRCADAGLPESDISVTKLDRSATMPDASTVVIGAPIYGGVIPTHVRAFLEAHEEALFDRRVALFLSCLYTGDRAEKQLADNFPPRLVAHSFGHYYVGGRIKLSELRWLDRQIMKRVAGVDHDVDNFSDEEIGRIVEDIVAAERG
jgi:menaquinone-dependent protoporphyrinogen oxidase